jgi:hypothetical protein
MANDGVTGRPPGKHERDDRWLDFGKRQVEARGGADEDTAPSGEG